MSTLLSSVLPHSHAPTRRRRSGLALPDLVGLVRVVSADRERWEQLLRFPRGGDRWWIRLSTDDRVDVWLLSWLPGQSTDLHDHGDSAAAFTVVQGRLDELRVDANQSVVRHERGPGAAIWLAPGVIHDVIGAGAEPAVSIHAYSPPLQEMTYYTRNARGTVRRQRTEVTVEPERGDGS